MLCANTDSSWVSVGKACFYFPACRHNISSLFLDLFHCEGKIKIVEYIRQRQLKDQKVKYFQILTEIKMKLLKRFHLAPFYEYMNFDESRDHIAVEIEI